MNLPRTIFGGMIVPVSRSRDCKEFSAYQGSVNLQNLLVAYAVPCLVEKLGHLNVLLGAIN